MVIVVVIVGSDGGGVVLVWSGLMVEVGSGSESCGCEYCGGVGGVGCFTFCRVQRTVLRVGRVQSNRLTTYREADSQADRASTLMTSFRWTDPYSAFIRTFETFARRLQILADCV